MHSLFTRARAEQWRLTQAGRLRRLAATHRRAETLFLASLAGLLLVLAYLR